MPATPRSNPIERRMDRFLREPPSVRNAVSVIVVATLVVVVAGGVTIRLVDREEYSSIWIGMWWALQTVSTVGYGDVTPTDAAGRLIGALVMLQGLAFLSIITAGITSMFVRRVQTQRDSEEDIAADRLDLRLRDISTRLDRLESLLAKFTRE